MEFKSLVKKILLSTVASAFLIGCGSSSDNGSSSSSSSSSSSDGTAVDPYIIGAKMYYDANNNNIPDPGEILSTETTSTGKFTFSSTIPTGGIIRIHPAHKGIHNGVPFTGDLSAKFGSTGVVSPLTTLGVKGFTNDEIITLLGDAGITITKADITADPMEGLDSTKTSATDADLVKIQATVAVNTFLEMVGTGITKDQINSDTNKEILEKAVTLIKSSINKDKIGANAPADAVLKVAISISDYLVEKTAIDGTTDELNSYISDTNKMSDAITALSTAMSNGTENPTWNGTSAVAATKIKSLSGRAIDNAIPNAKVELKKNGSTIAITHADSAGNYSFNYDFSLLADTDNITMAMIDPNNDKNIFESSLGTGKRLKAALIDDEKIDSSDIPDVSISNVTTAKIAMVKDSSGNIDPTTYDKIMEDNGAIVMSIASAIKYSVDSNKTLTVDANDTMNMSQFASTVAGKYKEYNPSAPMTNIDTTIASYVSDVNSTQLKSMTTDISDVTKNKELATNTVKPSTSTYQLPDGTYQLFSLTSTHYKDREDFTKKHPKTYSGAQDTLTVKFNNVVVANNTIQSDRDPMNYTNGTFSSNTKYALSTGTITNRWEFKGSTLTYDSSDNLIAAAPDNSTYTFKTVKDQNGSISYTGYGIEIYDWSQATANGDDMDINISVNNNYLGDDNETIQSTKPTNSISNDWNLTDEKATMSISGIISGNGVSTMPYSVVAGLNDTSAVDKNITILQDDGTWKQISLHLATDATPVTIQSDDNGDYEKMSINGEDLPMSFTIEFEAPEDGITTTALLLSGNISDGTTTDTLNATQSFFKDGFMYLRLDDANLGYHDIVIDLVNNVGYALSNYEQIHIDDAGTVTTNEDDPSYWYIHRSKVNFVK